MSNEMSRWWTWVVLLLALYIVAPPIVSAQAGSPDTGELAVFGGGTFGMGSHPAVGGSAGKAFSRYAMMVIDAAYQPLGQNALQSSISPSTVRDSHLWDFDFNIHIRVPVNDRWEPYGIAGVGFLWNHASQNLAAPEGNTLAHNLDHFSGSFVTGGGLRYYVRENWGIQPEVKVIVSTRVFTRVSVGVFYDISGF